MHQALCVYFLFFLKFFRFFKFTIVFLGEIFYNLQSTELVLFGNIYQKSKEETAMVQLIVGKKW